MLNPDNATLEWAAQWILDSLKAETNERTIEFGKNMAMTLRAATTDTRATAAAPSLTALQWAYNEGIDAAKSVIRGESFADNDTANYIVPCLINAIARKTNPYAFKNNAPEPPDPAAENVAKEIVGRSTETRYITPENYVDVLCRESILINAITAALQARDERAARIAENDANQRQPYDCIGQQTGFRIARKIRSKETPNGSTNTDT